MRKFLLVIAIIIIVPVLIALALLVNKSIRNQNGEIFCQNLIPGIKNNYYPDILKKHYFSLAEYYHVYSDKSTFISLETDSSCTSVNTFANLTVNRNYDTTQVIETAMLNSDEKWQVAYENQNSFLLTMNGSNYYYFEKIDPSIAVIIARFEAGTILKDIPPDDIKARNKEIWDVANALMNYIERDRMRKVMQ
jgi:hypothetical protein